MKQLWPLGLVLSLFGCNKAEFVDLQEPDLTAVRQLAYNDCLAAENPTYEEYKLSSAEVFAVPNSTVWTRDIGYTHEYKEGATTLVTHNIRVWRNTGTFLYLFVEKVESVATNNRKYFLRLPLTIAAATGSNEQLINDLKGIGCVPRDESDDSVDGETVITGSSSGPLSAKKTYTTRNSDGTYFEYTETYNLNFDLPAWVGGSMWGMNLAEVKYDINDAVLTTKNFTSTFTRVTTAQTALPVLVTDPVYQSRDTKVHFCDIVTPTAPVIPGYATILHVLPFTIESDPHSCPDTTVPVAWTGF